jgi:hypothetical protein
MSFLPVYVILAIAIFLFVFAIFGANRAPH